MLKGCACSNANAKASAMACRMLGGAADAAGAVDGGLMVLLFGALLVLEAEVRFFFLASLSDSFSFFAAAAAAPPPPPVAAAAPPPPAAAVDMPATLLTFSTSACVREDAEEVFGAAA